MSKEQLKQILKDVPLDDEARALAQQMIDDLDEQAAALFLIDLKKKAEALAAVLESIGKSITD